jgi:hypothetical protein
VKEQSWGTEHIRRVRQSGSERSLLPLPREPHVSISWPKARAGRRGCSHRSPSATIARECGAHRSRSSYRRRRLASAGVQRRSLCPFPASGADIDSESLGAADKRGHLPLRPNISYPQFTAHPGGVPNVAIGGFALGASCEKVGSAFSLKRCVSKNLVHGARFDRTASCSLVHTGRREARALPVNEAASIGGPSRLDVAA